MKSMRFGIRDSGFGRAVLPLFVAVLLSGCGFHMRGGVKLLPSLQRVAVIASDPSSPVGHGVENAMKHSGATIVPPGEGVAEIRLTGIALQTLVNSVGGNARVNEFNMVYHVELEVVDSAGKTLIEKEPLEQSRSLTFDPTQAAGTGALQDQIRREMERDMAQTVMRKIDTVERHLSQ
jgi:LPS-assembly lipoprotein